MSCCAGGASPRRPGGRGCAPNSAAKYSRAAGALMLSSLHHSSRPAAAPSARRVSRQQHVDSVCQRAHLLPLAHHLYTCRMPGPLPTHEAPGRAASPPATSPLSPRHHPARPPAPAPRRVSGAPPPSPPAAPRARARAAAPRPHRPGSGADGAGRVSVSGEAGGAAWAFDPSRARRHRGAKCVDEAAGQEPCARAAYASSSPRRCIGPGPPRCCASPGGHGGRTLALKPPSAPHLSPPPRPRAAAAEQTQIRWNRSIGRTVERTSRRSYLISSVDPRGAGLPSSGRPATGARQQFPSTSAITTCGPGFGADGEVGSPARTPPSPLVHDRGAKSAAERSHKAAGRGAGGCGGSLTVRKSRSRFW